MPSPLVLLIAGIAFLATLGGLYYKVHHDGYEQGRLEIQAKWDSANEKARQEEAARTAAAELTAKTSAAELAAAQQKAGDYYDRWQKARRASRTSDLAYCAPNTNTEPKSPTSDPDKPEPMFSHLFSRLWDSAWTDRKGKPLWPYDLSGGGVEASSESVTAQEILDNHGINAQACSENARRLNSLTDKINRLREGWK